MSGIKNLVLDVFCNDFVKQFYLPDILEGRFYINLYAYETKKQENISIKVYQPTPLHLRLIAPMGMIVAMVVSLLAMSSNNSKGMQTARVVMISVMVVSAVIVPILMERFQERKNFKEEKERRDKYLSEQLIRSFIDKRDAIGLTLIYVQDTLDMLPQSCNLIIQKGSVYKNDGASNDMTMFTPENSKPIPFGDIAISLFKTKVYDDFETNVLKDMLTFLGMYNVPRIEALNITARWSTNLTYNSISAPIGLEANGSLFFGSQAVSGSQKQG